MNLVSYIKTLWRDRELDPQGQVITPGTPVNADNLNKIEEGIESVTEEVIGHKADHLKIEFSEIEPQNPNKNTFWLRNMGEIDFSIGDGVAVLNATTSHTEPETELWFEKI